MRLSMIPSMRDALLAGVDLARKSGAAAKIAFRQVEHTGVSFESGRLKSADSGQTASYRVEVVTGGRRASTVGNDPRAVGEMVERALTLARAGAAAHFDAYPAPAPYEDVALYSESTVSFSRDEMIRACGEMVDALKAYDAGLFIAADAETSESEALLVTSGGVCHESRTTLWHLSNFAQRTDGTDILFAGYGRAWRDMDGLFDPAFIVDETLTDLRHAERIEEPPTGKVTALLAPEILGMFTHPILIGTSGRNAAKGDSPLRDRLGDQVLDPALTLIDDPHVDFSAGASRIDSDGIPTRQTTLFDQGVFKTFLYDLDSAGLAGAQPTGHTGCHPYFLQILPGARTSRDMLAGLDDAILIKGLLGFGQSNVANGDFASNVALGYRVRNGEITGRIKNTMIAGNVYDLLAQNVELSSDRDPAIRMPHALVHDVAASAG